MRQCTPGFLRYVSYIPTDLSVAQSLSGLQSRAVNDTKVYHLGKYRTLQETESVQEDETGLFVARQRYPQHQ